VNKPGDLIDTGEMYLRCVLELEEEGTLPLRARLAERLGHSIPTVSQTVARMERYGLVTVTPGGKLELTPAGRLSAVRVMRKHRIAECLLADILSMDWPLVHEEACRWEHVISEAAERRVLGILGHPAKSPYGNPIPGLAELGVTTQRDADEPPGTLPLAGVPQEPCKVVVHHIAESAQSDAGLLTRLSRAGIRPGAIVSASHWGDRIRVGEGCARADLDRAAAARICVTMA